MRRALVRKDNWRTWLTRLFVKCPGCGVEASLDHEVEPDGDVNPSLDCPSCDFHQWVTLESYTGRGMKRWR